jgi:hypothetical protein
MDRPSHLQIAETVLAGLEFSSNHYSLSQELSYEDIDDAQKHFGKLTLNQIKTIMHGLRRKLCEFAKGAQRVRARKDIYDTLEIMQFTEEFRHARTAHDESETHEPWKASVPVTPWQRKMEQQLNSTRKKESVYIFQLQRELMTNYKLSLAEMLPKPTAENTAGQKTRLCTEASSRDIEEAAMLRSIDERDEQEVFFQKEEIRHMVKGGQQVHVLPIMDQEQGYAVLRTMREGSLLVEVVGNTTAAYHKLIRAVSIGTMSMEVSEDDRLGKVLMSNGYRSIVQVPSRTIDTQYLYQYRPLGGGLK